MNIDKETIPSFVTVSFPDSPKTIKHLRDNANANGYNDEEDSQKSLLLNNDSGSFDMEEYYFEDGELNISGNIRSEFGDSYISIVVPLSDKVLIDILEYSCKKLNKLKTALETLK